MKSSIRNVGILGDGQLSRMLCEAVIKLKLTPSILTNNLLSSAANVCSEHFSSLNEFINHNDLITIENEFLSNEMIHALEINETKLEPKLSAINLLQDKLKQKFLLEKLNIPTSKYLIYNNQNDPITWTNEILDNWNSKAVLKWSRYGYDGKGTFIIQNQFNEAALKAFFKQSSQNGSTIYAEKFIEYQCETAMIGIRSTAGEFKNYPLVLSRQKNGICFEVQGPLIALKNLNPQIELQAETILKKIADEVTLTGAFGVEFFLTKENTLVVNEIAPRVHNTGHYTLTASKTSQFENHIRAISGMPLGDTSTKSFFLMRNLLGPEGFKANISKLPIDLKDQNAEYYWYEKNLVTPNRKCGHINMVYDYKNSDSHNEAIERMNQYEKIWKNALKNN